MKGGKEQHDDKTSKSKEEDEAKRATVSCDCGGAKRLGDSDT